METESNKIFLVISKTWSYIKEATKSDTFLLRKTNKPAYDKS